MVYQIDGIYSAAALWDDPAALSALFAPLPADVVTNIQQGRQQAVNRQADKGFRGMRHDPATHRAFFVVADATRLLVWTFRPASQVEAATMWMMFDADLTQQITTDVAMRVYREATGGGIAHVQ